jgi:hypothetical protein
VGSTDWRTLDVVDLSRSGMRFAGHEWPMYTPIEIDGLSPRGIVRGRVVRTTVEGSGVRFQRLIDDVVA